MRDYWSPVGDDNQFQLVVTRICFSSTSHQEPKDIQLKQRPRFSCEKIVSINKLPLVYKLG